MEGKQTIGVITVIVLVVAIIFGAAYNSHNIDKNMQELEELKLIVANQSNCQNITIIQNYTIERIVEVILNDTILNEPQKEKKTIILANEVNDLEIGVGSDEIL